MGVRQAAGVIIIRAGGPAQKFCSFSKKSHSAKNCRTVPKFSPFPISIHCRTHSARAQNRRIVGSQSESSITSSESNTLQLRQSIRIKYYVTRVVSQSKSSITSFASNITSPESSRLGWETLCGSRLEWARYSLS